MAATAERGQLQRIIKDLHDAVTELSREFKEIGEPVTDDSPELRKLFYKVEYLLQFDQKEKITLLGNKKDYWDYFCDCLAKEKGANDGIRFVKSISEFKTSLGKGRAFLRYSLVHQRLADTLQQCFMNTKVTSDWYYARSPFLKPKISSDIVSHLYELTEVQFDLASRGYDLDASWPTFSRKTLASPGSAAFMWRPPSRCSSMSSLGGGYIQAEDFSTTLDLSNSLSTEPLEALDEMRTELDQSDLRYKELQDRLQQLEVEYVELQSASGLQKAQAQLDKEKIKKFNQENDQLTKLTEDLRKKCEASQSAQDTVQELQECLKTLELSSAEKSKEYQAQIEVLESSNKEHALQLQLLTKELELTRATSCEKDLHIEALQLKTTSADQRNLELLLRVNTILNEKEQQSATQYESALKIEGLLERFSTIEREKEDTQKQASGSLSQLELFTTEPLQKAEAQSEQNMKMDAPHLSSFEQAPVEEGMFQEKESELVPNFSTANMLLTENRKDCSLLSEHVGPLEIFYETTNDKKVDEGNYDMTEEILNEQKVQIRALQEQIKSLNMSHVKDLMQFKETEEALKMDIEKQVLQKAELEKSLFSLKEDLVQAKTYAHSLEMENHEAKEVLHRTNTEMAELGIQICALSSEKEEIEKKLHQTSTQLRELQQQAAEEKERLESDIAGFREANENLGEKLKELERSANAVPDLQRQLNETQKQASSFQEVSKEEISTVKFQMSAEILNYENKLKTAVQQQEETTRELEEQKEKRLTFEKELADLQALREVLKKQVEDSGEKLAEYESTMKTQGEELVSMKEELQRTQTKLEEANNDIEVYREKLTKTLMEKESNEQVLQANLEDLTRTKEFLEERLVELIRDKDVLWQKSDALEYEQKLRAEERWLGDTEVLQCLNCRKNFSWMVRRHHCRQCGGIFCYYCCNNYKMTKHSGKQERCCNACYNAPSVVVSNDESEGSVIRKSSPTTENASPSTTRGVTVTEEDAKHLDDVVFDIITDEELSQVHEGDSSFTENQSEVYSLDHSAADMYSSCSSLTLDEPDDLQVPQDNELRLLKSGELMLKLPLTLDEIYSFGENNRELFIKSSTYSIIPITVTETGVTISWMFTTDTKSISFSVVYQEAEDSQLDQFKVLIPMTRCNSHKESIRGQLKARNCGIYTLIFDNSFSRFISKKVFYHLAVERPVVYDGSDFI